MTGRRSRFSVWGSKRFRDWVSKNSPANILPIPSANCRPILEALEARRLMTAGPWLVSVQPDNSDALDLSDQAANVRDVAPAELTLKFDDGQVIDAGSLSAIRVLRSGADYVFDDGSDVVVEPASISIHDPPGGSEVVIRFAESLPSDIYRVEILGAGSNSPLVNSSGESYQPLLADNDGDETKDTVSFELALGGDGFDGGGIYFGFSPGNFDPVVVKPIEDRVIPEDGPDTLIVLDAGVFFDADGDALSFTAVSSDTSILQTSVAGSDLTLSLRPNAFGDVVVTVTASDGKFQATDAATSFSVSVTPVNDPPTTLPDHAEATNTPVLIDVLANDYDVDNAIDPATLKIVDRSNDGVAVVANGKIQFMPAAGFSGVARFTYSVQDAAGAESEPTEVAVDVKAPPVANDDAVQTAQAIDVEIDVLQNDIDSDGTIVNSTVAVTTNALHGTTVVDNQTGKITYRPSPTYSGMDSFQYTVEDNDGLLSNVATVTITVTPRQYWQNPSNPYDVNADGAVTPIDVLLVINRLNKFLPLPLPPTVSDKPVPYYDVNGNNVIEPNDALRLINLLNASGGAGEGEAATGSFRVALTPGYWQLSGTRRTLAAYDLNSLGAVPQVEPADQGPVDFAGASRAATQTLLDSKSTESFSDYSDAVGVLFADGGEEGLLRELNA